MSRALNELKGALSTAGEYTDELEVELEELDQYNELFDDIYEARDIKDYYEELTDIFDDAYDAQVAKDFIEAAGYAGLDDADLENVAYELEEYHKLGDLDEVREAVQNSDGGVRVADLENELVEARDRIAKLEEKVAAFENSRLVALNVLDGVPVEQANKLYDELRAETDEARREAEEGAYVAGIMDHATFGEQGIPLDLIIAPEDDGMDLDLTDDPDMLPGERDAFEFGDDEA